MQGDRSGDSSSRVRPTCPLSDIQPEGGSDWHASRLHRWRRCPLHCHLEVSESPALASSVSRSSSGRESSSGPSLGRTSLLLSGSGCSTPKSRRIFCFARQKMVSTAVTDRPRKCAICSVVNPAFFQTQIKRSSRDRCAKISRKRMRRSISSTLPITAGDDASRDWLASD
jgi:hypothetical protein